ncbi:MAG: helix-turn-helix transcriptional regulator [Armatimonadota bacterium]|nr:helix-turn-helix transcriptional regulator [Armatimonadota bacterium]MDR7401548.1 helix-turn-helix transcriptional regulator [Armatimonadota bacterium]MDR7403290.1 helix-turn-helix transcriptional regulator [Armatimonadota bacterium]MDR7437640.1 helix-turn-helix transcriptional regulator [Armatimonadota bacterium]MDR7471644.1 helix-turn-helix transcriptional regulator [Armatimonadota bacterium]
MAGRGPAVDDLPRRVRSLVPLAPDRPLRKVRAGGGTVEVLCEVEVDGSRYVLSRITPAPAGVTLSPRERQIAALVARGLPTKAIAAALSISAWTVATHLRRIYHRLGVGSRAAMVARLLEDGVLTLER